MTADATSRTTQAMIEAGPAISAASPGLSNVDLADRLNLSPSSCLRRTKRLEELGVIDHYAAVLDPESVGLGPTVFVTIRVNQRSRATAQKIEEGLLSSPHVVACHMVSGDADFLVELVVEDLKGYEKVLLDGLLAIDEVTDTRSWFAFCTVRSRGPLPVT